MSRLFKITFMLSTIFKYLKSYRTREVVKQQTPAHIVFCTVDHYEPGTGGASRHTEIERVNNLLKKYPELVAGHFDSAGNIPKRTWFFPPHYHRHFALKKLVSLCERGYGEIELHLHHGKIKPDTPENLEMTIMQCIKEYSYFGIFGYKDNKKKYCFIHGDWALDNSRNGKFCGVNNEIDILLKTGCYADFTFPSMNEANPSQINSIYYALDDPTKPKSYNYGNSVKKHAHKNEGLMLIQGPLYPFFKNNKLWGLRVVGDVIDGSTQATNKRIDSWVNTGIHIQGVPDTVFIKTHTHGAANPKAVLGNEMDFIFRNLESNYNDSKNYILHYVTAREMYNIINALKDGHSSEKIEEYRNYIIKPPQYDSSIDIDKASKELKSLVYRTYG